jgi:hypothetical protein
LLQIFWLKFCIHSLSLPCMLNFPLSHMNTLLIIQLLGLCVIFLACTEEMRTTNTFGVRKPEGKWSLGRPRFIFVFIICLTTLSVSRGAGIS